MTPVALANEGVTSEADWAPHSGGTTFRTADIQSIVGAEFAFAADKNDFGNAVVARITRELSQPKQCRLQLTKVKFNENPKTAVIQAQQYCGELLVHGGGVSVFLIAEGATSSYVEQVLEVPDEVEPDASPPQQPDTSAGKFYISMSEGTLVDASATINVAVVDREVAIAAFALATHRPDLSSVVETRVGLSGRVFLYAEIDKEIYFFDEASGAAKVLSARYPAWASVPIRHRGYPVFKASEGTGRSYLFWPLQGATPPEPPGPLVLDCSAILNGCPDPTRYEWVKRSEIVPGLCLWVLGIPGAYRAINQVIAEGSPENVKVAACGSSVSFNSCSGEGCADSVKHEQQNIYLWAKRTRNVAKAFAFNQIAPDNAFDVTIHMDASNQQVVDNCFGANTACYDPTQKEIWLVASQLKTRNMDVIGHEMGHWVNDNYQVANVSCAGRAFHEGSAEVFFFGTAQYYFPGLRYDNKDLSYESAGGRHKNSSIPQLPTTCLDVHDHAHWFVASYWEIFSDKNCLNTVTGTCSDFEAKGPFNGTGDVGWTSRQDAVATILKAHAAYLDYCVYSCNNKSAAQWAVSYVNLLGRTSIASEMRSIFNHHGGGIQ